MAVIADVGISTNKICKIVQKLLHIGKMCDTILKHIVPCCVQTQTLAVRYGRFSIADLYERLRIYLRRK